MTMNHANARNLFVDIGEAGIIWTQTAHQGVSKGGAYKKNGAVCLH